MSSVGRVIDRLPIWLFSWLSASKVSSGIVRMKEKWCKSTKVRAKLNILPWVKIEKLTLSTVRDGQCPDLVNPVGNVQRKLLV
jgi:hypothetical protein